MSIVEETITTSQPLYTAITTTTTTTTMDTAISSNASECTPIDSLCTSFGTIYILTSNYLKPKKLYKIGYSFNFNETLHSLNAAHPLLGLTLYPVYIVDNVKCVISLERRLHAEFYYARCIETFNYRWFMLESLDAAKKLISAHIERMHKYIACDCITPTEKQVYDDMHILVKTFNIEMWMQPQKLSFHNVCQQFGINIFDDIIIRVFANIIRTNKAILNDQLLDIIGYANRSFKYKINAILRLLHRNPHIVYTMESSTCFSTNFYKNLPTTTTDDDDDNDNPNPENIDATATTIANIANQHTTLYVSIPKRYIIMTADNFEMMLRHLKTFKIIELQHLYGLVKCVVSRYIEYEQMHALSQ